jgi:hypothetical protein
MNRRGLALVLSGAVALTATQAKAIFDGNDVYRWCRTNKSMAVAYSAGILDQSARISFTLDTTVRPPRPDVRIDSVLDLASKLLVGYCIPDQATMEQVTDVLCDYLRDTPGERHVPAAYLFQHAMQKVWPCPKS